MHIEGLDNLTPEGSGGFSQVFRATETSFDRTVAAKVLNFRLDDPEDRARFERECQAMAQLSDHPYIVPLYSTTYTDEGYPVIIMEFFTGGTLWAQARKGAGLERLLDAGVKIASALHTAHERGVTHRDVKPQNVLMSRFGEPGLTDFGISAFDRVHGAQGRPRGITIAYAAPEALDGVSSRRTDVYSLASTLYTVLADQRPFDNPGAKQSTSELIRRILNEDPPPLQSFGFSAAVDHAIRRVGMARTPGDRPATAAEFGELLRRAQKSEGFKQTPWLEATDLTDTSLPTVLGDESQAIIHEAPVPQAPEPIELASDAETANTGRRVFAAVAGIAAVVLVGLIALFASGGSDDADDELADATPVPIATVDDFYEGAPLAPRDVTITRTADGARLEWTDSNTSPTSFEIQPWVNGVATGAIIEATGTSAEIAAPQSDCFTMRAVRDRGQLSLDIDPVCLPSGSLLVALSPTTCAPGACEFELNVSGAAAGSELDVTVNAPDGSDPNDVVASAYPTSVVVTTDDTVEWTYSPGAAALPGSYTVTVTDAVTGAEATPIFLLTS